MLRLKCAMLLLFVYDDDDCCDGHVGDVVSVVVACMI